MAKFNTSATKPAGGRSPITAEATPTLSTFEGGAGYARDAKSELFLLAVSNMVGEDTFYEKATDRDARYTQLVQTVAVQDPEWTTQFLIWLRTAANMRSASLVGALDAAKALVAAGIPGSRQIVAAVLQRADEPGEALAYWTTHLRSGGAEGGEAGHRRRCRAPVHRVRAAQVRHRVEGVPVR